MGGGDETPEASAQEKALVDLAEKKFNWYEKKYAPLAKEMLNETKATQARQDEAAGLVNADSRIAAKGRVGQVAAAGLGRGLTMDSARIQSEQSTNDKNLRSVRGYATANAIHNVKKTEQRGRLAHVKIGHGLASDTQSSMAQQAQSSTSTAIQSAQADLQESNAFATGLGQAAGSYAAYGGFGKPGTPAAPGPTPGYSGNPHW